MRVTPEQIDALLPQTQCGLCQHKGCMPYAEAIVFENAPLHLCPPGGVKTLQKLGELTQQSIEPFLDDMRLKEKPPAVAVIREQECIGCMKCIAVCPVDAILGTGKNMHTVISDECTGCELCIAPCPVDCIDMVAINPLTDEQTTYKANHARQRYHDHTERITRENTEKNQTNAVLSLNKNKAYIQAALHRVKDKKLGKNDATSKC